MTPRQRVLAYAQGNFGPEYSDRLAGMERRRDQVMAAIEEGGLEAYGFTTRLGHRDDEAAASQNLILHEHLVGPTQGAPESFTRLALACLLDQLLRSPSGAPPNIAITIRRELERPHLPTYCGAWLSSYGSGDVVPGAWLLHNLIRSQPLVDPGAVISGINGNHMSTAVGWIVGHHVQKLSQQCISATQRVSDQANELRSAHWKRNHTYCAQLPVSLRDLGPIYDAIQKSEDQFDISVDLRLSRNSGNPLFNIREEWVEAVSQSSFLGLELTYALCDVGRTAIVACGYLHRTSVFLEQRTEGTPIQIAKVVHAHLEAARLALPNPTNFTAADSNDVEDVRDLSLITACGVAQVGRHVRAALAAFGDAHKDIDGEPAPPPSDLSLLDDPRAAHWIEGCG